MARVKTNILLIYLSNLTECQIIAIFQTLCLRHCGHTKARTFQLSSVCTHLKTNDFSLWIPEKKKKFDYFQYIISTH